MLFFHPEEQFVYIFARILMKCISCKTKTWLLIKELHVHAIEIPHKTSKYISPCNDVLYRIYLSDMLKKMEFFFYQKTSFSHVMLKESGLI